MRRPPPAGLRWVDNPIPVAAQERPCPVCGAERACIGHDTTEVDEVIRQMGTRWSDEHIAATLNRMGVATPFGHTWNAKRVGDYRRIKGIPGYESAVKDGRCLTMVEAAEKSRRQLLRDSEANPRRDIAR